MSLTPFQKEIATMVARGMSDRSIALKIGRKTRAVSSCLALIYRKLGFQGSGNPRAMLMSWVKDSAIVVGTAPPRSDDLVARRALDEVIFDFGLRLEGDVFVNSVEEAGLVTTRDVAPNLFAYLEGRCGS